MKTLAFYFSLIYIYQASIVLKQKYYPSSNVKVHQENETELRQNVDNKKKLWEWKLINYSGKFTPNYKQTKIKYMSLYKSKTKMLSNMVFGEHFKCTKAQVWLEEAEKHWPLK